MCLVWHLWQRSAVSNGWSSAKAKRKLLKLTQPGEGGARVIFPERQFHTQQPRRRFFTPMGKRNAAFLCLMLQGKRALRHAASQARFWWQGVRGNNKIKKNAEKKYRKRVKRRKNGQTFSVPKSTKLDAYKQQVDQWLVEAPYSAIQIRKDCGKWGSTEVTAFSEGCRLSGKQTWLWSLYEVVG